MKSLIDIDMILDKVLSDLESFAKYRHEQVLFLKKVWYNYIKQMMEMNYEQEL